MRRAVIWAVAVVVLAIGGSAEAAGQRSGSAPTFAKDVAPIMFSRCVSCHREGEIAPMSLLTYEQARPWAKAIREKVRSREMPPWHSDPRFGKFRNDPTLTQEQIDTIVAWVDAGAQRGDDRDLPPAPKVVTGWQGGQPDYVFEMAIDFPVPAEGQFDMLHFWAPIPFKEDRFAEALELRPGDASVVHHARVDVVSLPEGHRVVDGVLVDSSGRPAERNVVGIDGNDRHLISFVPGRGYERQQPGTGKRLWAGKWVRFELHYNPNGVATTDRTKLGVWFSKTPVSREIYTTNTGDPMPTSSGMSSRFIAEGKEIGAEVRPDGTRRREPFPNIPPYAENWKLVGVTAVTEPITLYALTPHMHLRGKDLTWIVTWPDGREETVLSVPKYDFNWQTKFEFERPLELPAGSKITAIGHYDNSPRNRFNPAPDKDVYWAAQSWDEMFIPYMHYTIKSQNLLDDRNTTKQQ
jgi:mono/diheme cytochrome c family protein